VQSVGCDQLSFSDMTIGPTVDDPPVAATDAGLVLMRTNSAWSNIDVIGFWYEEEGCDTWVARDSNGNPTGLVFPAHHTWSNSTFTTKHSQLIFGTVRNPANIPDPGAIPDQGIAYFSECDVTEFYGGKISLHVPATPSIGDPTQSAYAAVAASGAGTFEGYGTQIEVVADVQRSNPINGGLQGGAAGLVGLLADAWTGFATGSNSLIVPPVSPVGGTIELSGGSVLVDGHAVTGQSVTAAFASNYGTIETQGTSFTPQAASGQAARRIAGTGRFDSPYFRQNNPSLPFVQTAFPGPTQSLTGQDAFLEGGCDATGTCGGAGTQKHFMIYDGSCDASNPWRDQSTGACRVSNPSEATADDDLDGVPNVADSCVSTPNPPVTPLSFQHTTGGQLDDDGDGYGNQCDADFNNDGVVNYLDLIELQASYGKSRSGTNCGSAGTTKCAIFDLDGQNALIGAGDLALFRSAGVSPGPKCTTCPLP
jgi:hypothetical protein